MTPEEYKEQKPVHDAAVHSALEHLADKEAAFTTARYGNYHTPDEWLEIIEEEKTEASITMRKLGILTGDMNWCVYGMRRSGAKVARAVCKHALHLAQEAIHIAATAKRFIQAME